MSKRVIIGALFLFVAAYLFSGANAYAISWKSNLEAALDEAKGANKPLMVDFYTGWCGWCKKLDSDTYSDAEVQKLADKFVCVKIDADKNSATAAKYRVTGYPTVLFLGPDGAVIDSIIGYKDASAFAQTMSSVLSETGEPAGSFILLPEAPNEKKKLPPSAVDPDFVYNGYIEVPNEELTAQINYGGATHFVQKGDMLKDYRVLSVDKKRVVLRAKNGVTLAMELKKPVKQDVQVADKAKMAADILTAATKGEASLRGLKGIFTKPELTAALVIVGAVLFLLFLAYVYFSLCLHLIARKTDTKKAWLAWIPIANLFLMCKIGRISYWWLAGLLVPAANLLVTLFIWYKIIVARKKSGWLTILFLVPVANCIVPGYLAFSKR